MSKYYLTVVYEVDGAVAARTILDARPWKASSHSNAIHDCDAARLEIESLRERVQELGQLARDVNARRVMELEAQLAAIVAGGMEPLRKLAVARSTQDRAVERDELLQAAINFIQTLTGMTPPPIEVAPPEVFAPFRAFVEKIQEITDRRCAASVEPLRKRCLHQISEPAQPVGAAIVGTVIECTNGEHGLSIPPGNLRKLAPGTKVYAEQPAAQALDDGCPHGSKHIVHDCMRCGAPVCCGKCCAEDARALDAEQPVNAEIAAYAVGKAKIERAIQPCGGHKWAVRIRGEVLNKQGFMEYEPQPSSRDDAFMARCRFDSAKEAIDAAIAAQQGAGNG